MREKSSSNHTMTSAPPTFIAAEVCAQTKTLADKLSDLLRASKLPEIQALSSRASIGRDEKAGSALTLAFVGQYDAGKSSIIKALTDRADIPIDADVCTTHVTAYAWHELMLLDTPGVQAGYTEHDAETAKAIVSADLVVFVITAELFSESSARYFRRLMFDDGKARESLLVVNKITLDNGTEEVKRPNLDAVCSPFTSWDFNAVFMDAKSYLDSITSSDEQDCHELRELSNFDGFMTTLNQFACERCDLGRITQPLFQLRSITEQAAALAAADNPTERAAIELLGRLEACVIESKQRLHEALKRVIVRVISQIESAGDDLADIVHEEAKMADLMAAQNTTIQKAEDATTGLGGEVKQVIEAEVMRLQEALAGICESSLGKRVLDDMRHDVIKPVASFKGQFTGGSVAGFEIPHTEAGDFSTLGNTADWGRKVGGLLENWGSGPRALGGEFLSASQAAGGQAHRFVYDAGKFFGKNFKPWEAVKIGQWIGNVGKILGLLGPAISLVTEILDEVKQRERQAKLADDRNDIRSQYREMARTVSQQFWSQFEEYERVQYDGELAALVGLRNQLIEDQSARSTEAIAFSDVGARANELIRSLH